MSRKKKQQTDTDAVITFLLLFLYVFYAIFCYFRVLVAVLRCKLTDKNSKSYVAAIHNLNEITKIEIVSSYVAIFIAGVLLSSSMEASDGITMLIVFGGLALHMLFLKWAAD